MRRTAVKQRGLAQSPRGQSALEYLVTYGWAILAIVIIGAALWYTGVFDPSSIVAGGKSCGGFSGFTCLDFKADSSGSVRLTLGNKLGSSVGGISAAGGQAGTCTPTNIAAGGNSSCVFIRAMPAGTAGASLPRTQIRLSFVDMRSGISHADTGFVQGEYENSCFAEFATPQSLAAYWQLDDAAGTTAKDSGPNGNSGTLVNSPTWIAGQNCKAGACLQFNGASQYVNAGNGASLKFGTGSFTILAWARPAAADLSGFHSIVDSWNSAPGDQGYILALNGGKAVGYVATSQVAGGSSLTAGNWYLLAWVRNGDTATLYVNGVQDASSPGFAGINANFITALNLGREPTGGSYFNGAIDEVAIFNRALSAPEIAAEYGCYSNLQ